MRNLKSLGATACILGMLCQASFPEASRGDPRSAFAAAPSSVAILAVTPSNNLLKFDSSSPDTIKSTTPITGLQPGEKVMGIDIRPRTGVLLALGTTSRIYRVDAETGAATQLGSGSFTPALNGSAFGFECSPTTDRLRVVSDRQQNLQLNSDGGVVIAVDGALAYATGDVNAGVNANIVSTASTYNASAVTHFAIDSSRDVLATLGSPLGTPVSPGSGQLFTIGPLGLDTTADVGFDIAAETGVAFASLTPTSAMQSTLYTINLATGAATAIGPIGGAELIRDLAIVTPALNVFSVSAASFSGATLASESIVAAFGDNLALTTERATRTPLPTSLGGTTVKVRDSLGSERLAPLFMVARTQLNYLMPEGTSTGIAVITVTPGAGPVSTGVVEIALVSPGVFSANANGRGVAASSALRVRANGSQNYELVTILNPDTASVVPLPIDLGPETDEVYLLLFGTGIRFRSDLAAVTVSIGGSDMPVLYAGPSPYDGLDQINVRLLRTLIGRGEMDVVPTVDGLKANTVRISVK